MAQRASFGLSPITQFENTKTNIRRPREIACFSYDDERKLLPLSEASLRYYYPAFFRVPWDQNAWKAPSLSRGFDTFRQHDQSIDEHLDAMLDTLQAYEEQKGEIVKADVVTWRGMITKIMTCLYERQDGFEMNATYYEGTIYIEEHKDGEAHTKRNRNFSRPGQPSSELMQYWGYKFEQISTLKQRYGESSRAEIESRDEEIVNNEAQYCSLNTTAFGNTSLLIGGEIDAVLGEKSDDPNAPIEWVELKTSKQIRSDKDRARFEEKLLKYWAQSFLVGVPHIIVGFRSENGDLVDIEHMSTHKISSDQQRRRKATPGVGWDGNVCVTFTASFLQYLKSHINAPGIVWRIQRAPKDGFIQLYPVETVPVDSLLKSSFVEHRERMLAA